MDSQDTFELFIVCLSIAYKYLLAEEKIWGWILAGITSLCNIIFLLIYCNALKIIIILECCFLLLSLYGIYKHKTKNSSLTSIDLVIITSTILAILTLTIKQIQMHLLIEQILASIFFLVAAVTMAQKQRKIKIIAWSNMILGSICMLLILLKEEIYILCCMHIISVVIALFTIKKLFKKPIFS